MAGAATALATGFKAKNAPALTAALPAKKWRLDSCASIISLNWDSCSSRFHIGGSLTLCLYPEHSG
ncbi:Uncharacterised protein [Vibrio cholerae]|nr:Uncharacterised protein [Vibrio cholerae]